MSQPEYEALARFRHAIRVVQRVSDDAVRAAGLTPTQHQLLLAVKGHPGPAAPSASDVAEALQLQLHSAVELINRAEASGLLSRRPDPGDARRHLLSLTGLGEARLGSLARQHRDELGRLGDMMRTIAEVL